jgi:hypothetical protein
MNEIRVDVPYIARLTIPCSLVSLKFHTATENSRTFALDSHGLHVLVTGREQWDNLKGSKIVHYTAIKATGPSRVAEDEGIHFAEIASHHSWFYTLVQ